VKVTTLPPLRIVDLILSFPLLEDLAVVTYKVVATDDDPACVGLPTTTLPSTPPMTGSLRLFQGVGMGPLARRLLSIPGGIHFRKLTLTLAREEDLLSSTALVEGCYQTLEYINISCEHLGVSIRYHNLHWCTNNLPLSQPSRRRL